MMSYRTNSRQPAGPLSADPGPGPVQRERVAALAAQPSQDVPKRLPQPGRAWPRTSPSRRSGRTSPRPVRTSRPTCRSPTRRPRCKIGGRWRFEPAGRTLVGDRGQTTRGAQYEVSSLVVQPTADQLAAARPGVRPRCAREYTQVPGSLPTVVKETAERVTKGATNDYERAVKLQDWFAVDGGFTLRHHGDVGHRRRRRSPGSSRTSEGFCVHFSFTMAAMARTLGIPARVAVGFTPGTAQSDGPMSVGLRDAHAWPELYFEGVGLDPLRADPDAGAARPTYTRPDVPPDGTADPTQPAARVPRPRRRPRRPPSDSCPPQLRRQGECGCVGGAGRRALRPIRGRRRAPCVLVVLARPAGARCCRCCRCSGGSGCVRARLGSSAGPYAGGCRRPETLAAWREITDTAWDHGIGPDESQTPRKAAARIVRLGRLDGRRGRGRAPGGGRGGAGAVRARSPGRPPGSPRTCRRCGRGCGPRPTASPGCARWSHHARPFG